VTVRIVPPPAAEGDRADGRFTGEVSSTNTIAASVEAYVEALNAMLADHAWTGAAADAAAGRGRVRGAESAATAEYDTEAGHIDTTEWFNR
jgi:hypothetical protein